MSRTTDPRSAIPVKRSNPDKPLAGVASEITLDDEAMTIHMVVADGGVNHEISMPVTVADGQSIEALASAVGSGSAHYNLDFAGEVLSVTMAPVLATAAAGKKDE